MSFLIHDWMVLQLGLSGGELLVYAIIYSYSRHGVGCFFGAADFLGSRTGLARETVARILKRLTDRGLLKRSDGYHDGAATIDYVAVRPADKSSGDRCDEKSHGGVTKNHTGCDEKSHPHTDVVYNNYNACDNKDISVPSDEGDAESAGAGADAREEDDPETVFQAPGGNPVRMLRSERAKLDEAYGEKDAAEAVDYLSLYKGEKPYKSKSDYLAIRRWVIDAVRERRARAAKTAAMEAASAPKPSAADEIAQKNRRIAEGLRATRRHPEDYIDLDQLKEGSDDDRF